MLQGVDAFVAFVERFYLLTRVALRRGRRRLGVDDERAPFARRDRRAKSAAAESTQTMPTAMRTYALIPRKESSFVLSTSMTPSRVVAEVIVHCEFEFVNGPSATPKNSSFAAVTSPDAAERKMALDRNICEATRSYSIMAARRLDSVLASKIMSP